MARHPGRIPLVFALLSACATQADTRPETADYISEAILAPNCGRGACHSSVARVHGFTFDTIDASIVSMKAELHGKPLVIPADTASQLVTILSTSKGIMPPDAPLPQADIDLITRWVADGAMGLE